jgi:hypothetical protein
MSPLSKLHDPVSSPCLWQSRSAKTIMIGDLMIDVPTGVSFELLVRYGLKLLCFFFSVTEVSLLVPLETKKKRRFLCWFLLRPKKKEGFFVG